MRQYQRLMRRRVETVHTEAEFAELFDTLTTAPGTNEVEIIEKHPKGGYRVRFDLIPEEIDDFIAYLKAHDWMSVM
jgi:hypothetical protein